MTAGPALRSARVRVLDDRDLDAVASVLAEDPVGNVFVAARVGSVGLDPWRLGAEVWGYQVDGRLRSLCYAGANFVPVATTEDARALFADRGRRQGRRCASIVGRAAEVRLLWRLLQPWWGPPREMRTQPLLAVTSRGTVPPDPLVRRVQPHEIDTLLPACIAMFREEVGVPPFVGRDGSSYRASVAETIRRGRAFARIENGRVLFKAEVGAATRAACQVHGVWVAPEHRGRGLAVAGMAAVVDHALTGVAPVVSLYVNDYNIAARRAYERVGFTEIGEFVSVLF